MYKNKEMFAIRSINDSESHHETYLVNIINVLLNKNSNLFTVGTKHSNFL